MKGVGLKDNLTQPWTKSKRCSFAELYTNRLGVTSNQPVTGPIRFFVSHAWAYKFEHLVQAIDRYEKGNRSRAGAFYFIDYFAINQWKPVDELDSLGFLIQLSEAVVLVMSPLEKPIPMSRCWCLYELHTALKLDIPIHVTVPNDKLN